MLSHSVKNPWASAILVGLQDVLNVPRHTDYRGPCLIHVAPRYDDNIDRVPKHAAILRGSEYGMMLADLRGCIAGVVDVVASDDAEDCQLSFALGPVCLRLKNPRIFLEPITDSRLLGLREVDDSYVRDAIATALPPGQWIPRYERLAYDAADKRGDL